MVMKMMVTIIDEASYVHDGHGDVEKKAKIVTIIVMDIVLKNGVNFLL